MHPDFLNIIDYLNSINMPFVIFTCGILPKLEETIDRLKESEAFLGFLISLHGINSEMVKNFTGNGRLFEKVIKTISKITKEDIHVMSTTVLHKSTISFIKEIADFGRELGVNMINFNRFIGRPSNEMHVNEDQLKNAVEEIEGLRNDKNLPVHIGNCIPQCFVRHTSLELHIPGISYATIAPDAMVKPGHYPLNLGNILEQDITEIWSSPLLEDWLSKIPSECQQCTHVDICPGGSRELANYLGLAKDPLIQGPIEEPETINIDLSEYLTPIIAANTKIRKEELGHLYYNFNSLYLVKNDSHKALDKIFNEKKNLLTIMCEFGADIVNLTGELYYRGLVDFD